MARRLPQRPPQYFIDEILLPEWDPSGAVGFDVTQGDPSAADFMPTATSVDDVGAAYPSLVVQRTNETSGGQTGYDFLTSDGPGQNRDGNLLVTVRAEDREGGYTGDSSTYDAVAADDLVAELIAEVADVCSRRATAPNTDFSFVSAFPGADAPDDTDATPTVRIAQTTVQYAWIRE
jgi:hypothetical protein